MPLAKETANFDSLTFLAIFVCTVSTSTNVANWLFATSYFAAGHKFNQILQNHSSSLRTSIYASPVSQPFCLDKLCTFWTVTTLFFIIEFLLASILFYDFKKVLQGDTSISQGHVKLSLTIFLGIKNMLALWTTILLARSICEIKENLAKCGRLRLNSWALRLKTTLFLLQQFSQWTQLFVMIVFFWHPSVDKELVHKMDVIDDVSNAGITFIYWFIFSTFADVEKQIR